MSSKMDLLTDLPPWLATTAYLSHLPCLQEEGAQVEGSRGLHGSPQCPSYPWRWTTGLDCKEEGGPTTLPASFSPAPQSSSDVHSVITSLSGLVLWKPSQWILLVSTKVEVVLNLTVSLLTQYLWRNTQSVCWSLCSLCFIKYAHCLMFILYR